MRVPQFLLLLGVFTTTSLVSLPSEPAVCFQSWGSTPRSYGQKGQDGRGGRDGRDGQSGINQTIRAEGTSLRLELSGQDGTDGEDGENAENPRCGRIPEETDRNTNFTAAGGGSGGRGGAGGNGGNGGSVTLYYTNRAHLSQIFIRSQGGQPGRAGRGGLGTAGCRCWRSSWTFKRCTGTPGSSDYRCTDTTYRCTDGIDGANGQSGQVGRMGALGKLTLIPRKDPLPPDTPVVTVPLSDALNRTVSLSRNRWQTLRGAIALLAPGSVVDDEYQEFVDRLEGSFQLVWNNSRIPAEVAGQGVTLTLDDNRQVRANFPEELWVEGTATVKDGVTRFAVANVVRQSEVTKLAVSDFTGRDSALNFSLVDLGGQSTLVNTAFRIRYRADDSIGPFDRFGSFTTAYEGEIPPDLVKRDYNRFSLAVGKLPIPARYLQPGVKVEIELVATRSFGGRSKQQTLNWQGEVRR
ncbi:MAG: hypothetical protein SFW36_21290 [Leptolyngbyaceae cyanobacterium bins.59]|nr:hypothetical protein [Leptolyngbyaceae cyanobacterium bins.59]